MQWLRVFWLKGWAFDDMYNTLFVHPFVHTARLNRRDLVDRIYTVIARIMQWFHDILARTQNGILRYYVMGVVIGAVVILSVLIWKVYI